MITAPNDSHVLFNAPHDRNLECENLAASTHHLDKRHSTFHWQGQQELDLGKEEEDNAPNCSLSRFLHKENEETNPSLKQVEIHTCR